jgi:hypothetical protein
MALCLIPKRPLFMLIKSFFRKPESLYERRMCSSSTPLTGTRLMKLWGFLKSSIPGQIAVGWKSIATSPGPLWMMLLELCNP